MKRSFFNTRRGNVSVIFTLAAPLLIATGFIGTDYALTMKGHDHLQQAVDAAALAAAGHIEIRDEAAAAARREARARAIFESYLDGSSLQNVTFDYNDANPTYRVEAQATRDGLFGGFAKTLSTTISADATAMRSGRPTELVLAIDTTNSMRNYGSWEDSVAALENAIGQIDAAIPEDADFYVGFVPYSDRVNIGYAFED